MAHLAMRQMWITLRQSYLHRLAPLPNHAEIVSRQIKLFLNCAHPALLPSAERRSAEPDRALRGSVNRS